MAALFIGAVSLPMPIEWYIEREPGSGLFAIIGLVEWAAIATILGYWLR